MQRIGRVLAVVVAVFILAACEPEAVPVDPADLPAAPNISCIAVPPSICQQMLNDARINAPPGAGLVQMHIRCTSLPCTPARGEAESTVVYSNGETSTMGMGWEGAVPPPGAP